MNVLIVDDEAFMRMSLKSSLDWESHGYHVVGEANHGQDALAKLDQLKPDIMLLDIKMPVMDGLQLLAQLQERLSPPKVIMLSSYKEFEYVREGMRLGALDYIHKPGLDERGIIEVLHRAREAVVRERKNCDEINSLRENAERLKPSMKALFFKEWAEGAIRHRWEIEEKMKQYDIQLRPPNLVCFSICIHQFAKVRQRYKKGTEYLLYFAIQNILTETLRKFDESELFQHHNNRIVIVKTYSAIRSGQEIYNEQWNLIKAVQYALRKFLNIHVNVGVSGLHATLLEMPVALREAELELENRFFESGSGVSFYSQSDMEPESPGRTHSRQLAERMGQVKQDMEQEQWELLPQSIERLFEELRLHRPLSRQETLRIAIELHYLFSRVYEASGGEPLSEFPGVQELTEAESWQHIYEMLLQEVHLVRSIKRSNTADHAKSHKIKMVLAYIHEYYDRDLSLEELSHYVGVNSSYLSRLFKEQTSVALIQYINQYRVNKSLDLLLNSTMKTYEIAEKVGFKSTDNFYIAFKKIIGYPPNEVRKNRGVVNGREGM